MGYTKDGESCSLFMSGPLQLGAGDAPVAHCYVKAKPAGLALHSEKPPPAAPHGGHTVKLLAAHGRGTARTAGYNNVGDGMCELEDGSEPQMQMEETETAAACAQMCDDSSTCAGYSATDGGCLLYESGPLVANGMDALDGFQCFQKLPEEAVDENAGPPPPTPLEFGSVEERALAGEYANHWKEKTWNSGSCHEGAVYPYGTQQGIDQVCSDNQDPSIPEGHQCECMVAKAHSCYILCLPDMGAGDDAQYRWDSCMADCFPTPTCSAMCAGATSECKPYCVQGYARVSAIFKKVFVGISNNVADFDAEAEPAFVQSHK